MPTGKYYVNYLFIISCLMKFIVGKAIFLTNCDYNLISWIQHFTPTTSASLPGKFFRITCKKMYFLSENSN